MTYSDAQDTMFLMFEDISKESNNCLILKNRRQSFYNN